MTSPRTVHVPVMLHEVLEQLALQPDLVIVDGTVGAGGHSQQILQQMPPSCRLIGLDRDPAMLARAAAVVHGPQVELRQGSYAQLEAVLDELGIEQVDRVLLDLGLSSDQLADPTRGFGFDTAGPLDMRFDTAMGIPAAELLAIADVDELERIFAEYGEEPLSRRFALEIVRRRQQRQPIRRADELAELAIQLTGKSSGKGSHPATRVFQALRIAVNRELDQLDTFLSDVLPRRLRKGGRAVILTFHSLEDRLVKQAFRKVETWHTHSRKPIVAIPSEVRLNPRSRSAKLRVAERI